MGTSAHIPKPQTNKTVFNLVRAYTPFTILLFFIAGFVLHADALIAPYAPVSGVSGPGYDLLIAGTNSLLHGSAFTYTLLGIVVLMAVLLYLNTVLIQHRVFLRPGYVPAFVGLFLSVLLPALTGFSVWVVIMGLVALAIGALLKSNTALGGRRTLFNAGFWTGCAMLLAFPSLPLIMAMAVGLAVLRPFKAGEWLVLLLGLLTPAYFSAALLFLVDLLPAAKSWPALHFVKPGIGAFGRREWASIIGAALLTFVGAAAAMRLAARSAISVRRIWLVIAAGSFIATTTALLCTGGRDAHALLLALPWLTPVVAAPAAVEKKTRFGTFIFYALIALVIAVRLL